MTTEIIQLEADIHNALDEEWGHSKDRRDAYAIHVFKAATEGNPAYTVVHRPVITYGNVREGFITARISFEVERA